MSLSRRALFALPALWRPAGQDEEPSLNEIIPRWRSHIEELLRSRDIPRLALAVVDAHGVAWHEAWGVSRDAIFPAHAVSMPFTAAAVLAAVERGWLALDDRPTVLLDGFTALRRNEEHGPERIRVSHLLSHSSGLPREAPTGNSFQPEPGDWPGHVASFRRVWMRHAPGERFSFSYIGYDLLAALLEHGTAKPFARVMRELVLDPLGLRSSTFDPAQAGSRALAPPIPMLGACGLYTTTADLARFLTWQIAGAGGLFSSLLREKMRTPQAAPSGAPSGYGFGLAIRRWYGRTLFHHAGLGFGVAAFLAFVPEERVGVALLSDHPDAQQLLPTLALSLLKEAVETLRRTTLQPDPLAEDQRPAIAMPEEMFERFAGTWLCDGRLRRLVWDHDRQKLSLAGVEQPLRAHTFTEFSAPGYRLRFRLDEEERPSTLMLTGPEEYEFCVPNELALNGDGMTEAEWERFLGHYVMESPWDQIRIEVGFRHGWLCLLTPVPMRLHPYSKRLFFTPEGDSAEFTDKDLVLGNIPARRV
jgi:CubicO group peptidase (beta-lactamase class C family)